MLTSYSLGLYYYLLKPFTHFGAIHIRFNNHRTPAQQEKNTMSEENKAIARRFYSEVASQGNLSLANELVAEDFVDHNPPGPDIAPGREGLKQVFTAFRSAFPDMKGTLDDQVAEGDKVVSRLTFSGTHQGDYLGMPATGKSFSIEAVEIFRFEDGMIAERWGQADRIGMMQQLGLAPAAGE
jgi:steroid delta-isomerase-like uncharacterized protein